MWDTLPQWSVLIEPVVTWLRSGILLIGAALMMWSIYQDWTTSPDRFSWMTVMFKVIGFGLVAFMMVNAQTLLQAIAPVT